MKTHQIIKRICLNAFLLALLCVVGMFSIPMGENIKVSLQLLIVFIIALINPKIIDVAIVTGCYLLMGLFLPIYAGFNSGVSATFGYVIGFVVGGVAMCLTNMIPIKWHWLRYGVSCLVCLLIVYAIGTGFMYWYLNTKGTYTLAAILGFSIVPYLPFDAAKIVLAVIIAWALRKPIELYNNDRQDKSVEQNNENE